MITVKDILELATNVVCGVGYAFVGAALIPKCETVMQWFLFGLVVLIVAFFHFMAIKVIRMPS